VIIFLHSREVWATGRPVASNYPFVWDKIEYVVIHWPGHDGVPDGDINDRTDIGAYLRNAHERYLDDPNRGYSLGYSCAVDYLGGSWQIRGEDFRAASNAPTAFNERAFSINYLTDLDGNHTDEGVAEVNRLINQVREIRPDVKVIPHGDGPLYVPGATPTQCPGTKIRSLIETDVIGAYPPSAPPVPDPTPEPPGDDPVTDEDIQRIADAVYEKIWNSPMVDPPTGKTVTVQKVLGFARHAAANADKQTRPPS
jgi:hypothetical protein